MKAVGEDAQYQPPHVYIHKCVCTGTHTCIFTQMRCAGTLTDTHTQIATSHWHGQVERGRPWSLFIHKLLPTKQTAGPDSKSGAP